MRVLGLSAFYHDAAAALVVDGDVVAAAQEERFTRRRHDAGFPRNAVAFCLDAAATDLDGVDLVAFYDKPLLKFERLLESYLAFAPRGFRSFALAMPLWLREKLFQKSLLVSELASLGGDSAALARRLRFAEHHQSHAASAFYPSPFREAAVLTLDGVGEWATTSLAVGSGHRLEMRREIRFPHSLGLLYSAFTGYTGFKINSGEYKLMGLAPYGEPRYESRIRDHLIDIKDDGSFRLDMEFFDYCTGLAMTNARFAELFEGPPRRPDEALSQRHMDLAASVQRVAEDVVVRLARAAARDTGQRHLCLAGGVALNCVANARIVEAGLYDDVWIQPAAGDAGGALGAALAAYHWHQGRERRPADGRDAMRGAFLGPEFPQAEIERRLDRCGARFTTLGRDAVDAAVVQALVDGKAVGWFQGRMEFGPRALGARSIIADPRVADMQRTLNLKVKFREGFRPFAPAVLAEDAGGWFELAGPSPYMLLVAKVRAERRRPLTAAAEGLSGLDRLGVVRSLIPAATHVDLSARVQTVDRETNPRFHALLTAFKAETGCPVLLNTSFNRRGEPIVLAPEDAFRCFMATGLDVLAIGDCILEKSRQDPALAAASAEDFPED